MTTLGKYEILEEVGRGGFAVVNKARDPDLDRPVALKVLLPHRAWDPTFAERFRNEAQATAKLSHPNIVIIHEEDEIPDERKKEVDVIIEGIKAGEIDTGW